MTATKRTDGSVEHVLGPIPMPFSEADRSRVDHWVASAKRKGLLVTRIETIDPRQVTIIVTDNFIRHLKVR